MTIPNNGYTIPPHLRKLLGRAALLATEDATLHEELLRQCAAVIQPRNILQLQEVWHYVNAIWEARRYANFKPLVIEALTKAKFKRKGSAIEAILVSKVWAACMKAGSGQPQTEAGKEEADKELGTGLGKPPAEAAAVEPTIGGVTEPAKAGAKEEEGAQPAADGVRAETETTLPPDIRKLVADSEKELAQLEQPLTDADYAASIEEWIEPVGQVETLERAALGRANMALENVVWVRTAFGGHPDVGLQIEEMPALAATHHAPVIEEQPSVELVDQLDMADATIPIFSVTEAPVGQVAPAEVGIVPADTADPLEQTAVEQASGEQTPGEQTAEQTPGEQTPGEQTREEQTPGEQTREEQTRGEETRGKQTRATGGLAAPAEGPPSRTPLQVADSTTSRAIPEHALHTSPAMQASASTPSSDEESSINAVVPPVSRSVTQEEAEDVAEIRQFAERNRRRRRMRQS